MNVKMQDEKIIAIGDVHGLTIWEEIVEEHPDSKIVFLGDYCDPYGVIDNDEVVDNLWNIVCFKTICPERVTLLLGNHDMHYIYDKDIFPQGSRFNPSLKERLHQMFTDSGDIFQYACHDGQRLYTHAGVSEQWLREDFGWTAPITVDSLPSIVDALNHPNEAQFKAMVQVGRKRGGIDKRGGIFWADFRELSDPATGLHQIVGHNRVYNPQTHHVDADTSITFCDCLIYSEYFEAGLDSHS